MDALLVLVLALLAVIAVTGVLFNALAYGSAAWARRRHPAAEEERTWPTRTLGWLRTFGGECGATALLTATFPLAVRRQRVPGPHDGTSCRPVILLHGYAQHTANFLWLARRLRRDGWRHLHSVRHTAMWGDIERSSARLAEAVDRIRAQTGASEVDVVAHSMGGLVARACIRARGQGSGIARLITLGTPHQGTEVFRWLRLDPMLAQMRTGSPLLCRLATADPVPALVNCTSIYSTDDALVPAAAAHYPGAINIEVRGLGHMSLLFSARVYELVREQLASAPAAACPDGRANVHRRG